MRAFIYGGTALAFAITAGAAQATQQNSCSLDHLNLASLENVVVMPPAPEPRPAAVQTIADTKKALDSSDVLLALETLKKGSTSTEIAMASLPGGGHALGYTRLRIKYTPCLTLNGGNDKAISAGRYDEESRGGIERFLVGKVDNHVLKFDATIEPIGVKSSSQLYSMLRNSTKDGQSWTTAVRNDDYLLPYFRLDTSSVMNFSANFQSEGSSKVSIGSSLMDIVERGSKLITPTALLITDKNKPRFNDAATFVDESLSKLFYKKVDETARKGVAINPRSTSEQHLTSIVLVAPHPTKTYITAQRPGRVIGKWDIYAEPLRESLFVELSSAGTPDFRKVDPATVLNLKISAEQVLRDRLASSEAIGKAAQLVAKTKPEEIAEPAIGLCRLVAAEAAKVGLAPRDMALAAWAFLADQGMANGKYEKAHDACVAVRHFPTRSDL